MARNKSDNQYEYKPGDWICPNIQCKNQNFARRMYCHLCQEPRPESKQRKDDKVKSPIKRKDMSHEQNLDRRDDNLRSFKANGNFKSNRRFNDNQFNNIDRDNFNNSTNINRNNFFPNNNSNINDMPISNINNPFANNPSYDPNQNPFLFQNMNQIQQQEFYSPNQNLNDLNNFYNPNPNSFNSENIFQNNNNNNMNFIPNNFPQNTNNLNPGQNLPFFMNQIPNSMMMFPNNNDNFNNFNPINPSLQNFPNLNHQLQQSQLLNNNQSIFPLNFNNNNLNSEQFDFNNSKDSLRNNNYNKRIYINERDDLQAAPKENKLLNRKRETDKFVEFEEDKQKKYSGTGARNLEYIKIGDWICRRCDNINFSYRIKCHRCKSFFEEAGENIDGSLTFC